MKLNILSRLFYIFLLQYFSHVNPQSPNESTNLSVERTRAIAAVFSLIQCFPNGTNTEIPADIQAIIQTNQNFNPEAYLSEYANLTEIQNLISFVNEQQATGVPDNVPFLHDPISIANFQIILIVLWRNAENWPLFYNTTAWLLNRVNTAMLFWCLNIVSAEKFSDDVTVPSTSEIFPQLYLPKDIVLSAAGLQSKRSISPNPLQYWMSDPGLNEFHTHFHMDMPPWWDANIYGIFLDRKGELFLYMHHNIVNRYNAERLSNGLPDVTPLGLYSHYQIPEGYQPNIVNVDFDDFPSRPDGWRIGSFEVPNITLAKLNRTYDRISEGIDLGYFITTNGSHVPLDGDKGTDILGATVESSNVYSADFNYYGSFHNEMHGYLSGGLTKNVSVRGVEAHQETAMRDRLFFQIHKSVDDLYVKYKSMYAPPYTKEDLEFSGIAILGLKVTTRPSNSEDTRFANAFAGVTTWPLPAQLPEKPVLTTYMRTEIFDISNAARPCRSVDSPPTLAQVTTLNHVPFTYVISVQSMRSQVAYGMVRIFLWPEVTLNGSQLEGDEAYLRAIELDRFRVRVNPMGVTIIERSSLNSTITRVEPSPGIKELYNVEAGSGLLTRPEIRRACAFPNNMLIPKGTKEGLPFKLTVYISDETDAGDVEDNQFPHYPYCGALKGLPFPDKRPMGFPFDRPGTKFTITGGKTPISAVFGCSNFTMTNVRQLSLLIKHDENEGKTFQMK